MTYSNSTKTRENHSVLPPPPSEKKPFIVTNTACNNIINSWSVLIYNSAKLYYDILS